MSGSHSLDAVLDLERARWVLISSDIMNLTGQVHGVVKLKSAGSKFDFAEFELDFSFPNNCMVFSVVALHFSSSNFPVLILMI